MPGLPGLQFALGGDKSGVGGGDFNNVTNRQIIGYSSAGDILRILQASDTYNGGAGTVGTPYPPLGGDLGLSQLGNGPYYAGGGGAAALSPTVLLIGGAVLLLLLAGGGGGRRR